MLAPIGVAHRIHFQSAVLLCIQSAALLTCSGTSCSETVPANGPPVALGSKRPL